MKGENAYAITLKYGKEKEEVLHGLIYQFRTDALNYFKKTQLYKPQYQIRKIKIIRYEKHPTHIRYGRGEVI